MTSTVNTKNMFNTLSEESNYWNNSGQVASLLQGSSKSSQKQTNLFKIGKSKGCIKYVVHNNYVPEKERVLNNAFSNMSNKEEVAKKLRCTKACNFVLKNPVTGEYGTCYRSTCTFAHSLEELNVPKCEFDEMCRYKQGRYNKEGVFDFTLKCTFHHSSETQEEWLERTGKTLPDLPKNIPKTVPEKVLGSGYAKKTTPFTPPKRIVVEIPSTPVKPSVKKVVDKKSVDKVKKNLSKEYKEKSANKCLNNNKDLHIIKVPSKELAEIAIKYAFENGVFNIQVIIE